MLEKLLRAVKEFQSLSGFWWGFCGGGSGRGGSRGWNWFQSLSGFWWGFCEAQNRAEPPSDVPFCFNPFQGFGGVSARRSRGRHLPSYRVSIPFRVLVGFLRRTSRHTESQWWDVSIPFRVLVGFLQGGDPMRKALIPVGFNPFQGFGGVSAAALSQAERGAAQGCFNPFQGFGGVSAAGRSALTAWRACRCFNPFQGFGGVSAGKLRRPELYACRGFNPFQGFGGVSARGVMLHRITGV